MTLVNYISSPIVDSDTSIDASTDTNRLYDDQVSGFVYMCGLFAPVLSILVFMSPIPTVVKIKNDQAVGTLPLLPYSSMVASTYLWVVYGLLKHQSPVIVGNAPGFFLGIYYFVVYSQYAPKGYSTTMPGSIKLHLQGIGIVIMISTLLPILLPYVTKTINPAELVGFAGVVFCVLMFASPLAALKTVIMTQSASSIPLPFTVMTICNCFTWTVFGLFDAHDPNLYVPNILGLSFGLAQAVLKIIFYNNDTKYHGVETSASNEDNSV